mmetsp:Transcript_58592/g.104195  ORF Transcript_58592/g.104195 Transcript_58592/m.104195 type:complete len:175 (-) Transcript_58592:436-960(-)
MFSVRMQLQTLIGSLAGLSADEDGGPRLRLCSSRSASVTRPGASGPTGVSGGAAGGDVIIPKAKSGPVVVDKASTKAAEEAALSEKRTLRGDGPPAALAASDRSRLALEAFGVVDVDASGVISSIQLAASGGAEHGEAKQPPPDEYAAEGLMEEADGVGAADGVTGAMGGVISV